MEETQTATDSRDYHLTIGLYTPCLQGFHIGELVNQIRQLCFIKGYRLIIIRTGGYGKFAVDLHLQALDGAILIRNAVSPTLAEKILQQNIPCATIGYDFFPLDIPIVSSDHEHGVKLAMDHLLERGHTKIAYIGDLSVYDIRKRYEAYCDLHNQYNLPLQEKYLYAVQDTLFAGGKTAAQQHVDSACDADAFIFGAGLTAIGFVAHIKQIHGEQSKSLSFACFDALPLIPVVAPEVVAVDQNLHLVAYRSLNVIEGLLKGEPVSHHTLIEPKLAIVSDRPTESYDAFLATCVDLPELYNPNYMKALITNMHEWPNQIADHGLDNLMSLMPLFEKFMRASFLSRHFIDANKRAWIKNTKAFTSEKVTKIAMNDSASLCRSADFPPKTIGKEVQKDFDLCTHFPIYVGDALWGFLTFYGNSTTQTPASSFYGFAGYIESLVERYGTQLELANLRSTLAKSNINAGTTSPSIELDQTATIAWNTSDGSTTWSDMALKKIGFDSALEYNIYRNIEITDRIHPEDHDAVRHAVMNGCNRKELFQFSAKIKLKNGGYASAVFEGHPELDQDNNLTRILFLFGMDDEI